MLRLGRVGSPVLARIETRDATLTAEIERLAGTLDRMGLNERRSRRKVVGWTLAACVSLVLVAVFGLPALVERIAPLIPMSVEQRFGVAIDAQVRSMLDTTRRDSKAFECGVADDTEKAGRAALDKLIAALERGADLPIALKTAVVRRTEANAIALPGGHIYVFEGLVTQAKNAEELAGVIVTRSATSLTATAPARCCKRPEFRSCSECCSAISPAADWWCSRPSRSSSRPTRATWSRARITTGCS